jgi:hypothetical protein
MIRPRRSTLVAGVVLTVAIACLFAGPVAATATSIVGPDIGDRPAAPAVGPPLAATNTTDIDPDAIVMTVALEPNGSARWSVAYRLRLDDENATGAFESLQADIAANESAYTDRFARRMNRTAALAENATGREMSVGEVSVSTRREALPQEYGVVTYRLRWFGFARVDGERIVAGDAIAGLFLDEGTSLRIEWPDAYRASAVDPDPDDSLSDSVVWRGQTVFTDDQPRVTVAPAPTATRTTAATDPTTETPQSSGDGPLLFLGGLVLLGLLAALAWLTVRRRDGSGDGDGAGSDDDPDGGIGGGGDGGAPTDAELLSNEERVLQLLEANGGRMKQQAIAEELEWTDAKTSQVVGGLREDDAVETFRLGRENVVTLPDAGGPIE